MVTVAKEMERRGLDLPLLIGGATTSRQHTAVRIAPAYGKPTVHVLDASRVVGVVASLLDAGRHTAFDEANRVEQERLRGLHAERERRPLLPLRRGTGEPDADRLGRAPSRPRPPFVGTRRVEPSVAELRDHIDWTFFFHAWELKGRYPAILDDPRHGEAARDLFAAAERGCSTRSSPTARCARVASTGSGPPSPRATTSCSTEARASRCCASSPTTATRVPTARSPTSSPRRAPACRTTSGASPSRSTARTSSPRATRPSTTTTRRSSSRALADRLAEAFAEWLHQRARREWYAPDEQLTSDDLVAERYRGIRPAYGYPACPDHSEKVRLFSLLDAEAAGLALTETCAMTPASAVSGLYFGHAQARYFSVGRVGRDQVEDYAARKGVPLREAERWLAPNLAYDPDGA